MGTGLKKCMPMTWLGRFVAAASLVIEIEEVLLARIASGFIAASTVLVDNQVNFCLIPEARFTLDGLLTALECRLAVRSHAVIVVAEGAGQDLLTATGECDASPNHQKLVPITDSFVPSAALRRGVLSRSPATCSVTNWL